MNKFLSMTGVILGVPIGISISFILEVAGVTGAIWGVSEVVELRDENNKNTFRVIALIAGMAALTKHVAGHIEKIKQYPNSSGFFQNFCHSMNNPYGAIYDQIKQCCQQTDGERNNYETI